MTSSARPARLAAIDGLRGVLATVVVADHAILERGSEALGVAASMSVAVFFVMSGYVLTRGWDGLYWRFLARRFVRLWPVFALAMAAGCLAARRPPEPLEWLWIPWPGYDANAICPPAWSLFIEAWAALAMPVIVWTARGGAGRSAVCIAACLALTWLVVPANPGLRAFESYFACFVLGAGLSRFAVDTGALGGAVVQWLGRVSYSLYLTHWVVLHLGWTWFGAIGLLVAVPACFGVAALVHRYVEMPSIALSRMIWRGPAEICSAAEPA